MKKRFIVVGIAVIALLAVAGALAAWRIKLQSPIVFLDEPQQVVVDDGTLSQVVAGENLTIIEEENSELSVSDVMARHGKGVAVDAECKAMPRTIDVRVQQVLVVENKVPTQRDIAIGNRIYRISGGGYALAAFPKEGTYLIRCGETGMGGVVLVTTE